MYKKLSFLILIALVFSLLNTAPSSVLAAEEVSTITVENGYYYETLISEEPSGTYGLQPVVPTTTRTKTTTMKNSNGETLWKLSITATFAYDGSVAECVSCTPNATSYNSAWTVRNLSSSRNNNSATATLIIRYTEPTGVLYQDYTKYLTITCDPNGNVS